MTPLGLTELVKRLDQADYLVEDGLGMALFLTQSVGQPLLLEGEPGVGKTAAAIALAKALDTEFIRLQCYEGITASEALYEWNYPHQLLSIRSAEGQALESEDLFTERFLLDRPLLRAIRHAGPRPPVLLIDEVDRADDEFEALLFEFLGESSVTVPELGTFAAERPPVVILTSNRSRELHDALKRRCYYHWIDYPSVERSAAIVRRNVPEGATELVTAATNFIARTRSLDLDKPPGLAEAVDWVAALHALGVTELERPAASATLGAIAKSPDDLAVLHAELAEAAP